MEDFVPQRVWHYESPTINDRSSRGRGKRFYVTDVAANFCKEPLAGLRIGSRGQNHITRRSLGASDELGKVIDVGQAQVIGSVFDILGGLANGGDIFGP